VIGLEAPDGRLHSLTPIQPGLLPRSQPLGFASMDHVHCGHVVIHAAIAEAHHRRGGLSSNLLQQRGGLLQLTGQGMTVIRFAGEGSGTHHQALAEGDRDAGLDTELIGLARLALTDALGLLYCRIPEVLGILATPKIAIYRISKCPVVSGCELIKFCSGHRITFHLLITQ